MTFPIMGGGFNATAPAFPVQRSVRLRSSAPAYFSKSTFPVSSPGTKFTMSFWMKVGTVVPIGNILAYVQTTGNGYQAGIGFANPANGQLGFWQYNGTNGYLMRKVPAMYFRDPSAWYHVVCIYDTTNATAEDRAQIWVNGVRVTAWAFNTQPAQNSVSYFAANSVSPFAPWLGAENRNNTGIANPFDGYLTEINFVDGQALAPSNFGSYNIGTGVWQPIKYAGTYGTNGFYLNFQDNSAATAAAIGKDSSGNGNNWTPNGITLTPTTSASYDSMLDVPTNTSNTNANFAVMNPLKIYTANLAFSNGNLTLSDSNPSVTSAISTMSFGTSGKYYFECTMVAVATANSNYVGVIDATTAFANASFQNKGEYRSGGDIYNLAGTAQTAGATYTTNDVIGVAVDVTAGTVKFYKNGVAQGATPSFTFTAGTELWACVSADNQAGTKTYSLNFGQRPFSYPLAGFNPLCTYNLTTPLIPNGAAYMAATTYTGTGSALTIANTTSNPLVSPYSNNPNAVPMQPDFVWIKGRLTAYNHALFDSVRGARDVLISNSTAQAVLETAGTSMTSFDSAGFSLGTNGAQASTNVSAQTFVAWQWKAGAGTTQTISAGAYGATPTTASTVSVNQTSGFSIVTFSKTTGTNETYGHGLSTAPKFVIVKARGVTSSWNCWFTGFAGTEYISLDGTPGKQTLATLWNSTAPSNTLISMGTAWGTSTYVAYCWSEVPGFSKFGSYVGTGVGATGAFVYCGFRPRWILFKAITTGSAENWELVDTSRNQYNAGTDQWLYPNLPAQEGTTSAGASTDILSNGFKLRGFTGTPNTSGVTYIFAAFAENPFNYSLAR